MPSPATIGCASAADSPSQRPTSTVAALDRLTEQERLAARLAAWPDTPRISAASGHQDEHDRNERHRRAREPVGT